MLIHGRIPTEGFVPFDGWRWDADLTYNSYTSGFSNGLLKNSIFNRLFLTKSSNLFKQVYILPINLATFDLVISVQLYFHAKTAESVQKLKAHFERVQNVSRESNSMLYDVSTAPESKCCMQSSAPKCAFSEIACTMYMKWKPVWNEWNMSSQRNQSQQTKCTKKSQHLCQCHLFTLLLNSKKCFSVANLLHQQSCNFIWD